MAAIWESHKDTLRTLYIIRGETLKSIMAHMTERYGFAMRCNDSLSRAYNVVIPLTILQQGSVRALVQTMAVLQEQQRYIMEYHRPQGRIAAEAGQDERGPERWRGDFSRETHQGEAPRSLVGTRTRW
jgi:hypothetical protein